jgi:hypothetical protein
MTAAARVLHGQARWAAVPAGLAVLVMLGYCGWALAVPAAVAAAAGRRPRKQPPSLTPAPQALANREDRGTFLSYGK